MIASIDSGFAGWSEYVLGRDGQRPGARLIEGDPEIGDLLCEQSQYSNGNYFRFVLSFSREELNPDDPADRERGREIVKEFFSKLMHGYRPDEFHLDIVEHTDTDELHYHVRIPKQNLLTGTKLEVYYHKRDLEFKKAIIDWQAAKYGLLRGEDRRRLRPTDRTAIIEKWREEHGQPEPKFSTPKERRESEAAIANYIEELTTAGIINSLDEVKAAVSELGLKIERQGYDQGKGFYYFTVSNDTGTRRIKGDYFGSEFWQHKAEDREAAIRDNRRIGADGSGHSIDIEEAEARLNKELAKRERLITKRYRAARERADRKNRRDLIQGDQARAVVDLSPSPAPRPSGRSGRAQGVGVSAQHHRPAQRRNLVSTEVNEKELRDEIERRVRAIEELGEIRESANRRARALSEKYRNSREAERRRSSELYQRIRSDIPRVAERIAEQRAATRRRRISATLDKFRNALERLADGLRDTLNTFEQLGAAVSRVIKRKTAQKREEEARKAIPGVAERLERLERLEREQRELSRYIIEQKESLKKELIESGDTLFLESMVNEVAWREEKQLKIVNMQINELKSEIERIERNFKQWEDRRRPEKYKKKRQAKQQSRGWGISR